MTTQQLQDLDAFRNEVRQAEFALFDLRAKLRLMEATHKNPAVVETLSTFGGMLERAMDQMEQAIDESEKLIKNSNHAKPA